MKTRIKKQGIEFSISDNYVIIFGPNISKTKSYIEDVKLLM